MTAATRLGPRALVGLTGALVLAIAGWFAYVDDEDATLPRPTTERATDPGTTAPPTGTSDEIVTPPGDTPRVRIDLYGELRQLARTDAAAFERRVAELLQGAPSDRLAAIRALCDSQRGDPIPALARTLADATSDATVQRYCFERLAPECSRESRAREAMIGFLGLQPADAAMRSTAFTGVLRWGDGGQVQRCLALLHQETAPDVVLAAASGLRASGDPALRQKAANLHRSHPDAKVRQRLRILGQDK